MVLLLIEGMPEERIKVIAYSGYRGEEAPREITLNDNKIEVVRILSRWVEEGSRDRTIKRFFRVKGNDGATHEIYYDEKNMEWFLKTERNNTVAEPQKIGEMTHQPKDRV